MNYTTIIHAMKLEADMTDQEYVVCDLIFRMCTNPMAPEVGFCTMDHKDISAGFGYTPRTLSRIIAKLREKDYIISSQDGKKLRTSNKYHNIRYQFERSKEGFFLDRSSPNWQGEVAKMARRGRQNGDYIYTKKTIILSLLDQEKIFEEVEADFSSGKNLLELGAARKKFLLSVEAGKYGPGVKSDADLWRLKYKGFLISWQQIEQANPQNKSVRVADKSPDLSDPTRYQ